MSYAYAIGTFKIYHYSTIKVVQPEALSKRNGLNGNKILRGVKGLHVFFISCLAWEAI